MYAIVLTGSKQYKVQKGDVFDVERLDTKAGKDVKLNKVLLYSKGKSVEIGKPYVKNVNVTCKILSHPRGEKLVVFKYRPRKHWRRKRGHRQELTRLQVKEIEATS